MSTTSQAPLQTALVDLPESQTRNDSLKSIVRLGDTLKYDFAYPTIYLRPNYPMRALALQQRFSSQNVVAIDIDLSDNAPANIELNCNTLLLVGGERYKGASKNLTLRCRRLNLRTVSGTTQPNCPRSPSTFLASIVKRWQRRLQNTRPIQTPQP